MASRALDVVQPPDTGHFQTQQITCGLNPVVKACQQLGRLLMLSTERVQLAILLVTSLFKLNHPLRSLRRCRYISGIDRLTCQQSSERFYALVKEDSPGAEINVRLF